MEEGRGVTTTETTRQQIYDETIKHLERKDHRSIAEFLLPQAKEAQWITLESPELPMTDFRQADFITKIKIGPELFIFHVEFEAVYQNDWEMQKRMLRYHTYIRWNEDLPIYQMLVILKKPSPEQVDSRYTSTVLGRTMMDYTYEVLKIYTYNKYEVLKEKKAVLVPLRVFMDHPGESEEEHIQECLSVAESMEDKDYYFLTEQCLRKLYQKSQYASFVKEEILMKSTLFLDPYEKGMEKGRINTLTSMLIKNLIKRFGTLSKETKDLICNADADSLEIAIDRAEDFKKLEDLKHFLGEGS